MRSKRYLNNFVVRNFADISEKVSNQSKIKLTGIDLIKDVIAKEPIKYAHLASLLANRLKEK